MITDEKILRLKEFGDQKGIDWHILYAILFKESNFNGFFKNKIIKSRFEPRVNAIRRRRFPKKDANTIRAESTSWGMPQIMGYHYSLVGFASVFEMIEEMKKGELQQLEIFLRFISTYNNGKFFEAIRKVNIQEVAKQYNGSNYRINNYDKDLMKFIKQSIERYG